MAIQITDAAAKKIIESLQKNNMPHGGLRLGVKGGGCSGLNYVIRFEPEKKTGDRVFEKNGAKIFIDMKSLLYLKGTTLDWTSSLMQEGFKFENPNARSTCSCGVSFTV
jgi:iron-sulfur cluster assembly protein